MMLAHNASLLGITFDPYQLYASEDRSYVVWLATLVDRVHQTKEKGQRNAAH